LNWRDTDGYAPRVESAIKRGYDNVSANLNASRSLPNGEIGVRHWQTEGNVEYLDFFLSPVDQDFKNSTTAVELTSNFSDRGSSKLVMSFMQDDISQKQSDDFVESDRISLDWQYSHELKNHTLTGGVFAIDENASTLSFGSGFNENTSVRAAFLQDQWSYERHKTFVAVRLTDHETFDKHTTWNAEYALEINAAWVFNAGLGHAFRAPDATDRFGFCGNPSLMPELADEAQLGFRFEPGTGHSLDIEFYSTDIDDLIDIEFDPQTFECAAGNIAKAEIRGTQLGYEFQGDRFVFRAELVKQSADDALSGARLLRRAEETATLSYTQDIGVHRFGLSLIASGDREDFGDVSLPGYVLANLNGQIRLGGSWTLHSRVENIFDTQYQTAANYRMQERAGYIELKYHWN
jgi:vitamin B12 transporter